MNNKYLLAAMLAVFTLFCGPMANAQEAPPPQDQANAPQETEAPQRGGLGRWMKRGWDRTGGKLVSKTREAANTARGRAWFKPYTTDADGVVYLARGNEHWQCGSKAILNRRGQEVQIDDGSFKNGDCWQGAQQLADARTAANTVTPQMKNDLIGQLAALETVTMKGNNIFMRNQDGSYWKCPDAKLLYKEKDRQVPFSSIAFTNGMCQEVEAPK